MVFDEGTVDMVVKVLVEVGVVMVVSVGVVMIMIALEAVMSCSSRSKVLTAPLHLRGSPSELDLPAKQKKKVLGACRVWGTRRICRAGAVHSAIKRFCGFDSVRVKRKYKDMSNASERWWFVFHDEESVLCALEGKWNLVEIRTCWKLESCFKPTVSVHSPAANASVVSDCDSQSSSPSNHTLTPD